ncbi:vacuolar iron transporter 1 [Dorcoceras hygrometricum]|uniref:Vacuolar iron transporter 1 n=1 Tax=Dorcoceras hygrometricum TaxID=472368 RepID=A0A2Z7D2F4_9LAMI|nr:vacuolar iron transporter 1 [Dorcoceras hygrometricum]
MINWFLQALSVIPRGSWGDVSRRFTMIRWLPSLLSRPPPPAIAGRRPPPKLPPSEFIPTVSAWRFRPQNFVGFLVKTSKGIENSIVKRIGCSSSVQPFKGHFPRGLVGARRLVARGRSKKFKEALHGLVLSTQEMFKEEGNPTHEKLVGGLRDYIVNIIQVQD